MTLIHTKNCEVDIVHIHGRLDANTASKLEAVVQTALDSGARKLLLECQGMVYVSSMGLRVFMVAGKLLASRGGRLAFAGLNPQNSQIFEMTNLSKLFPCFADKDSALSELARS